MSQLYEYFKKCDHCDAHDHQSGHEKCREYQLQQDINYVITEENATYITARKFLTGKDIRNPGYTAKSFSCVLQNSTRKPPVQTTSNPTNANV